ncbi:DNA topoisomerase 1 [Armadillidium nasatum]|uniref:DNA topoisomerase 1 n=1 Tax=Armadillidium nasatum TaxID=96803 RepID=A0A5N5SP75_9CRUS|nr:DNA topoisomerase 1 [Armadillidium nasatum]
MKILYGNSFAHALFGDLSTLSPVKNKSIGLRNILSKVLENLLKMGDLDTENKPMAEQEQNANGLPNGLANGTSEHKEHKEHKHKSKDKDRDKERSKEKDRHRDKDRHKSSHKDKDKEKSREKDRHSSHKSSHKEKDRDKDKEREKSREKDRERHRDKDREHKDKEKSNRDEKHKDRDRKDKDNKNDKHRDKSREKDKDRHKNEKSGGGSSSSSSKKDKHHSSSHKSSHKDKHRDKDRHDSGKKEEKEVKLEIKSEPEDFIKQEENIDYVNSSNMNDSYNFMKSEVKSEVDEDSLTIKEEPMDQTDSTMEDSQFSHDVNNYHVKEDSEEDSQLVIKEEPIEEEDDDVPLSARKRLKPDPDYNEEEEEDEDKPLISRKKVKTEKKKRKNRDDDDDEEDEDFKPTKKKAKKEKEKKSKVKAEKDIKNNSVNEWEEEKRDDGKKWTFLEHKGPVFADPYERLPSHVKFCYDGNHMVLSEPAEEVAGFYAKMLDHEYTTKEVFKKNFFKDWRKVMTEKEKAKITDLSKCDFRRLHEYYVQKNEERKNRTKEEKKALKEKNEAVVAEYGWCTIDGHKQRIGNFKIEPPGLFRGRGEHPKQGMLKKRTMPEDVIINCSKDSKIPKPPPGHKWKEVRHDPNVTWLACWNENIQGSTKYVMLNAASKLKGEKDWQKYETARRLHLHVDKIRENYRMDWKSKEMRIRQRGVALYFIDKLALRAGNEKDEDQADTVGCCSLRYEHLTLHPEKDGKEFVVTQILNKYLNELLEGLTAKVFRTYNASRTLQEQLEKMTNPDDPIPAKILSYNRANREVAILCNHQRAVPKTFDKSMENLKKKIDDKKEQLEEAEKELKSLKKAAKHGGTVKEKVNYEKKKKAVDRLREQLDKLEISATDKEENKQIALGTSKLNYLDPRITVAWCKKFGVPIDKVYNKTQRQKFQWAIDMATAEYNFTKQDKNAKFTGKSEEDEEEEEDE